MRRVIQRELEDPLALLILRGEYPAGSAFTADCHDGKITLQPVPVESPKTPEPVIQ
jgi:ATP-dependent Clp protease ATP-binding subunit ClpA